MRPTCTVDGCERPRRSRSPKFCEWHWLLRQPADVQNAAAERRVQQHLLQVDPGVHADDERWTTCGCGPVPTAYLRGARCRAHAAAAAHGRAVEKKYGLSREGYDALLAAQGGRCAICRARPRSQRLAVDHDHLTGAVRGLCCKRCNHDLLGAAHDDVEILRRAVAYLEHPPAQALSAPPSKEDWLEGW